MSDDRYKGVLINKLNAKLGDAIDVIQNAINLTPPAQSLSRVREALTFLGAILQNIENYPYPRPVRSIGIHYGN